MNLKGLLNSFYTTLALAWKLGFLGLIIDDVKGSWDRQPLTVRYAPAPVMPHALEYASSLIWLNLYSRITSQ